MSGIVLLDTVGVTSDFFHLPRSVDGLTSLKYYLVGGGRLESVVRSDRWDIIAVATPVQEPHAVLLRQFHILSEFQEGWEDGRGELREPQFDAWTEANDFFEFDPIELAAFHQFILDLAERIPTPASPEPEGYTYFTPVSAAAYAECGIPSELVERFSGQFSDDVIYRYDPGTSIHSTAACRFLRLSRWTDPQFTMSSTVDVVLETFTRQRVEAIQRAYATYLEHQASHPSLDTQMLDGEYMLLLSRGALREFAAILDERIRAIASVGYRGAPQNHPAR